MRGGKLQRLAKFTVGADGKIVDNGMGKAIGAGNWIATPVKFLAGMDGDVKLDPQAWKKTLLYGNVPAGFVAP